MPSLEIQFVLPCVRSDNPTTGQRGRMVRVPSFVAIWHHSGFQCTSVIVAKIILAVGAPHFAYQRTFVVVIVHEFRSIYLEITKMLSGAERSHCAGAGVSFGNVSSSGYSKSSVSTSASVTNPVW